MKIQDETKYVEEKIKKLISNIESEFYNHYMNRAYNEHYEEEYPGFTDVWIKRRIVDLYYYISLYLEMRGVNNYLQDFKKKFESRIIGETDLLKSTNYQPEEEEELVLIVEFRKFLNPFKAFDYSYSDNVTDDLKKLNSILNHTDHILKKLECEVNNEADIYNPIKWIIGLYFPSCRKKNKAAFIEQFKTYNPDILIPEIKTAIEYKYVRNASDNIDEFIDQIRIDAANYKNDYQYEQFIAVIYVEDVTVATSDSIQLSWESKGFPKNWNLVIAMGSPKKK